MIVVSTSGIETRGYDYDTMQEKYPVVVVEHLFFKGGFVE